MRKIIDIVRRFDWSEARDVEPETLMNLSVSAMFFGLALVSVAAVFFGAWWQPILGLPMCALGAVCLTDTQWGNESALDYLRRVFSK